jgi:hypothetical protein
MRRGLLVAALLALIWSLVLTITGGFAIETAWRLISSRNAVRPFVAGLAILAFYLAVWRRHWRDDLGRSALPATWPPLLGGLAAAAALILGVGWGTHVAAGPDQSGYVSEAALFARGELTIPTPPWSHDAPWNDAPYSASPVGWRPARWAQSLAPTYSPGLPLIMAMFQLVGGDDAVYYVVPLLGTLFLWSTYWLGSAMAGRWAGALGAVLVVSSPIFLFMQQQAMSDVPVAAFLTLSMAAAFGGAHPWLAGFAAAGGILTRPNLVPLTLIPFALLWSRGGLDIRRLGAFLLPVAAASAMVGALNWYYFASPLESGYGALANLYSLDFIAPNLRQYGRWTVMLHTPLLFVGTCAPLLARGERGHRWRTALVTLGCPLMLMATYMPFLVFNPTDWGSMRFLLPAIATLSAGVGLVAVTLVSRARSRVAVVAAGLVTAAVAAHGWTFAVEKGVFRQRIGDARFARAVEVAHSLPQPSVFISNSHSGTLRFYTGRDILRFEAIGVAELDIAMDHLTRKGYHLFFIGDEFELDQFRTAFEKTRAVTRLAQKPRALLEGVVIYPFEW